MLKIQTITLNKKKIKNYLYFQSFFAANNTITLVHVKILCFCFPFFSTRTHLNIYNLNKNFKTMIDGSAGKYVPLLLRIKRLILATSNIFMKNNIVRVKLKIKKCNIILIFQVTEMNLGFIYSKNITSAHVYIYFVFCF